MPRDRLPVIISPPGKLYPVASNNPFTKPQKSREPCPCRSWAGDVKWLRAAQADPTLHHKGCPRPRSVTSHALDRYIERIPRGAEIVRYCGRSAAHTELLRLMSSAVLHEVEAGSASVWLTPEGILLGVRDQVVTTVLPLGSRRPANRPKRRT